MHDEWLERARRLHAEHPVVDTLAPNWDSEMYLSPAMVELARVAKERGVPEPTVVGIVGRTFLRFRRDAVAT